MEVIVPCRCLGCGLNPFIGEEPCGKPSDGEDGLCGLCRFYRPKEVAPLTAYRVDA